MLLVDFYKITSKIEEGDEVKFHISLNPQHTVYEGHFPAQSVLPGVCILQIIKECAEEISRAPLRYTHITTCKFLSSVDPNRNSEIVLSVFLSEKNENGYQLKATGSYGDTTFIKLKTTMKTV